MRFAGAILAVLLVQQASAQLKWWQTTTFYQIYPRSFKDSNADGVGDLQGITLKLDHLVDIGIGGVWLSPVFESPMKDFGYDVSNFTEIDPLFGTMADFEALAADCKAKGLKLILDFVPNHSSDQHIWFNHSVQRIEPYTDYYVWRDASGENETGFPVPPNNWLSVFGGSAWTWNEERGQFYLHQFVAEQPDLNYRNPAVLEEMKEILRFWLDKGADGFRLDAIPHLMEDQRFLDEPLSENPEFTEDQWGSLNHIYTTDLPELYDIIFDLRAVVDEKQAELGRDLVMMVEAYTSLENTIKYYGDGTRPGAHFPFNFAFISNVNNETNAVRLKEIIDTWQNALPEGAWSNWVIGNHDKDRVATRFGNDFSIASVIMGQLLPGSAITYNGEEINMENTWISWEDTEDPQGCQAGEEYYEKFTRDPVRTPFQWDDTVYAGFTSVDSAAPWLPINPNYMELNLKNQKEAANSPYKIYKMLTTARKNLPAVSSGSLKTVAVNDAVFGFSRTVADNDDVLVLVNTGFAEETVDTVAAEFVPAGQSITFYTGSLDASYSHTDEVDATTVKVPARGAVVFLFNGAGSLAASIFLIAFAVILVLFK